jgi:hypothetical protein
MIGIFSITINQMKVQASTAPPRILYPAPAIGNPTVELRQCWRWGQAMPAVELRP